MAPEQTTVSTMEIHHSVSFPMAERWTWKWQKYSHVSKLHLDLETTLLIYTRSLVIDDLLKELTNQHNAPPIAYFYCSRDSSEPRRGSALEILLSILKQLACSLADEPLFPAVAAKWQERMNSGCEDRLDVQEAVDIIIQISSLRGAFIVVDALDECPKKQRQILLEKLDIIGQKSVSLVRIFASSRPNSDIREYFRKTPRLEILAKTNSGDIEDYVKSELENRIKTRKFLDGHPSPEIVTMVSESLIEQADGM